MKKTNKTPVAVAVGTAVVTTFSGTPVQAAQNPFGMTELSGGYMQVAETDKAGEMKCGASMNMQEGSCGEGKCGAMMGEPKVTEGQCAGNKGKKKATSMQDKGGDMTEQKNAGDNK